MFSIGRGPFECVYTGASQLWGGTVHFPPALPNPNRLHYLAIPPVSVPPPSLRPSPLMDRADLAGHATATRGQAKQDPKSGSSKFKKMSTPHRLYLNHVFSALMEQHGGWVQLAPQRLRGLASPVDSWQPLVQHCNGLLCHPEQTPARSCDWQQKSAGGGGIKGELSKWNTQVSIRNMAAINTDAGYNLGFAYSKPQLQKSSLWRNVYGVNALVLVPLKNLNLFSFCDSSQQVYNYMVTGATPNL